ncbi:MULTISPECIES: hypothetical protein [unclassified Streptomyces]|uniref:hypothetical protein n=1 Tax=unclassified Streptomyces TaxID=2593676 RepID=UPI000E5CB5A0|nr:MULTISPECIES: hypothetical protein [unclassified Streptomyces]
MTIEYESLGQPLGEYQLTRADHRRQQEAEDIAAWVEKQLAKAPRWSEEKIRQVQELFESCTVPPPWEYMRWRVRLYCGHIQEVKGLRRESRPDGRATDVCCSECGKSPAVIVAFEVIGPVAEPPAAPQVMPRNTASRPVPADRRTKAELEAENATLRAEVERLRRT